MTSSLSKIAINPPVHRIQPGGPFNRDWFHQKVSVMGLKLPASRTTEFMKHPELKGHLLRLPKVKGVVNVENDEHTRLLLLDLTEEDPIPEPVATLAEKNSIEVTPYTIDLDYDYWTAEEVLKSILPEDLIADMPTAFAIAGHLAHVNLRDAYLPYKDIIGQVILEKNKGLRTVVNKTDNIDTQFRFFKMETIAGEPDTIVEAHESGCRFKFDFAKVYWNSRLGTEHERLVSLFQAGDLVADVFAGVGPFAIPAARKGSLVLANDLNPSSTHYMSANCQDNRVQDRVRVTTMDGREFIKHAVIEAIDNPFVNIRPLLSSKERSKQARSAQPPPPPLPVQRIIKHFVMNLPATALEFLDAFKPAFTQASHATKIRELYGSGGLPAIHCHCFTRELERERAEEDIIRRAEEALGTRLSNPSLHYVRRVAPNKDMYCISFQLPVSIME
ncbi:hypothetical protein M408DRAFT_326902 [Serendipita vermifera MAFF 305830]|uniref:tRNA (guanine(37)-N1)-methyltransferase n=1 Tax=Serendipita vermifera MAFF 305830 TaxID=933852 RepID=A0A0C3BJN2_SERVB|nr:hypothetical protein M408DRAFT_326902 [Serendipita vermifera MAFF 305830]